MRLGLIGLDSSHATAFTELLNNKENPHHVKGGEVVGAFVGGSIDLPISQSRVKEISQKITGEYDIPLYQEMASLMEICDAVFITGVDARNRLEEIREIIHYQKPIFVDKPLALTIDDVKEVKRLANEYETPIMTSSALRFASALTNVIQSQDEQQVLGVDCYGPLAFVEGIPGYFWYGIHSVEMLQTIVKSKGKVTSILKGYHSDLVTITYENGVIGTIRGVKRGDTGFGGTIFFENKSVPFQVKEEDKPFYASLLENIILFFKSQNASVTLDESIQVISLIENINTYYSEKEE